MTIKHLVSYVSLYSNNLDIVVVDSNGQEHKICDIRPKDIELTNDGKTVATKKVEIVIN